MTADGFDAWMRDQGMSDAQIAAARADDAPSERGLDARYYVVDDLVDEPFGPFGVRDRDGNDGLLAVYRTRRGAEAYRARLIADGTSFRWTPQGAFG